jgi:hypothetical protein
MRAKEQRFCDTTLEATQEQKKGHHSPPTLYPTSQTRPPVARHTLETVYSIISIGPYLGLLNVQLTDSI